MYFSVATATVTDPAAQQGPHCTS